MKGKNSKSTSKIFIIFTLFCFILIAFRTSYLALSTNIDGINIKEFANDRTIVKTSIPASRGTIYDVNGDVLAQNVSSYTLIAYLDPERSKNQKKLYHVEDKVTTAEKLSTVIDMKKEDILDILNQEGLYQVEFGYAGKNLTEMEKEKIEALSLPGIDFIEDEKRYYPNGDFASYTIGYAKKNEDGIITGELGIEALLDSALKGVNGEITYQKDRDGRKIAGTKELKVDAKNGDDIYLTIDSNIELFVEQALRENFGKYPSEWAVAVVADAKTGKILAASQKPSYDPNILNIKNYMDITVSTPYEPGSIMKIYTYMAAMEKGTYDGTKTFLSGKYKLEDGTVINDWNPYGWGDITYDQGFYASSNVGVINIVNNFIDKNILKDYFKKAGFGEKTGITLANEQPGKISFTYESEVYNAAFGHGITTTPIQHIQALTSIANDGVMLKPYIVDKVVNSDGETIYKGEKTEVATIASKKTTDYIKQLMYDTVHSSWNAATATMYRVPGYDVIGKTGTAQLVNANTGKYYTDNYNSIKSFVGMWPKGDPQIIIYISAKKIIYGTSKTLYGSVKSIVTNVSKYLNILGTKKDNTIENITIDNYLNKDVTTVTKGFDENKISYLVLGNGSKIIDQYPKKSYLLNSNEKVILLTYDTSYKMPNLKNYSKKEVEEVCNMLNISCSFKGSGYVNKQSINNGSNLNRTTKVEFELK